jgi:hypothetical protein
MTLLSVNNIPALPYDSQMSTTLKTETSKIHLSLPHSLLDYYQECGHAGRDGKPATCVLFYNFAEHYSIRYRNERKFKSAIFMFKLLFISNLQFFIF